MQKWRIQHIATEAPSAFGVFQGCIPHGMKSSPLPWALLDSLMLQQLKWIYALLREQSRGSGEMTQKRKRSFSLWNLLGENKKIVELCFLLMVLKSRLICWGVLSEKLLNAVFEKNKWSNYSNQSFKPPAGSAGAKTLKNSTKKPSVIKFSLMKRKVDC